MKRNRYPHRLPDAVNLSPKTEFTQIKNELLRDENLSFKAKGLLCLLLSNEVGEWTSYQQTLSQSSRDGVDSIRNGLTELEERGYLLKVHYVDKATKRRRGSFWAYTDSFNQFEVRDNLEFLEKHGMVIQDKAIAHFLLPNEGGRENPNMENPNMGLPNMENPRLKRLIPKNTNKGDNSIRENADLFQENEASPSVNQLIQMYHKYCPSLPKVLKATERRKQTINARLREYPLRSIKTVFQKAEASDFLSGRSGHWAGCNLDWLMNENNLIKVLEGKYDNNGMSQAQDPDDGRSPEDLMNDVFRDQTLRKAFVKGCLAPAKALLQIDEGPDELRLVRALLKLKADIETSQKQNLSEELRGLLPGSISIIASYVAWLRESSWITDFHQGMFSTSSQKMFARFRRDQAKEDNQERDPLTGKSYIRA